MRVLFLPIPGVGHTFFAVPLAWALRSAGHDVLFGTAAGGLVAERAGLPVVDLKLGSDSPRTFEEVIKRHPDMSAKFYGSASDPLLDLAAAVPMFAEIAGMFTDPVIELARAWQPDLVVHSTMHGAALVAAADLGVPSVSLHEGFGRRPELATMLAEEMADIFRARGIAQPVDRHSCIDLTPPSMAGDAHGGLPMRFITYNGESVLPTELLATADSPKIAVTLGTVSPQGGGLRTIAALLSVAGDLDAEFVLALGDVDLGEMGLVLPSNVRVNKGWVPLYALLRTCTGLIHHGGGSTALTALAAGVPQLLLPDGSDRYITAAAVDKRGAAITATAGEVEIGDLRRLINDESLREAAQEVRAEMAAMPSPADLVPTLVRIAES